MGGSVQHREGPGNPPLPTKKPGLDEECRRNIVSACDALNNDFLNFDISGPSLDNMAADFQKLLNLLDSVTVYEGLNASATFGAIWEKCDLQEVSNRLSDAFEKFNVFLNRIEPKYARSCELTQFQFAYVRNYVADRVRAFAGPVRLELSEFGVHCATCFRELALSGSMKTVPTPPNLMRLESILALLLKKMVELDNSIAQEDFSLIQLVDGLNGIVIEFT